VQNEAHKVSEWMKTLIGLLLAIVFVEIVDAGGFDRRWCETYPELCTPVAAEELEEWKNDWKN
jgi:hypothetical protein